MKILVTGGAGYVGSHAVRALVAVGHDLVLLDNLSAGHIAAIPPQARLIVGDIRDTGQLDGVFSTDPFDAVLHFAGLIEVGESVKHPLRFYENNVGGSVRLLRAMQRHGVQRLVFSSTCAVYGVPERMPLVEDMPCAPTSPYARTKLAIEWALADAADAWGLGFAALRYFNAAGAADDATIGEDHEPETHLIPNVLFVPLGRRESVQILGTDYPTPDGTCIRDYVHVEDLADAHVKAIELLRPGERRYYNTGTGRGASVREVVEIAREVTGKPIKVIESGRRAGDVPVLYADAGRIQRELSWRPRYTELRDIVASAWNWHRSHPQGFADRARNQTS